jgi:hypothetical protein
VSGVVVLQWDNTVDAPSAGLLESPTMVAIFGTGSTAGDGILKAVMADPDVKKIRVFTRRTTPRIDAGVASGKVEFTLHTIYLDYSTIRRDIADLDTVYWAIGLSSVDEDLTRFRRWLTNLFFIF